MNAKCIYSNAEDLGAATSAKGESKVRCLPQKSLDGGLRPKRIKRISTPDSVEPKSDDKTRMHELAESLRKLADEMVDYRARLRQDVKTQRQLVHWAATLYTIADDLEGLDERTDQDLTRPVQHDNKMDRKVEEDKLQKMQEKEKQVDKGSEMEEQGEAQNMEEMEEKGEEQQMEDKEEKSKMEEMQEIDQTEENEQKIEEMEEMEEEQSHTAIEEKVEVNPTLDT
ncbi:unnamed protein product [Sympodiomycopsis kandeliae]